MTEEEVLEKVRSIIRETFDDDSIEITRKTTAEDVAEWDSLSNIELVVALESEFDVKFLTGEIAGFENVGDLVAAITARLSPGT